MFSNVNESGTDMIGSTNGALSRSWPKSPSPCTNECELWPRNTQDSKGYYWWNSAMWVWPRNPQLNPNLSPQASHPLSNHPCLACSHPPMPQVSRAGDSSQGFIWGIHPFPWIFPAPPCIISPQSNLCKATHAFPAYFGFLYEMYSDLCMMWGEQFIIRFIGYLGNFEFVGWCSLYYRGRNICGHTWLLATAL